MCIYGGGGWSLQKIWNKLVSTQNDFAKRPERLLERTWYIGCVVIGDNGVSYYNAAYRHNIPISAHAGDKFRSLRENFP